MPHNFEIKEVFAGYNHEPVLKNLNFTVQEGGFLGIIGPNGSGKSTLLRVLSRVLRPQRGEIFYQNRDLYSMPLKQVAKFAAFVGQDTIINFSFPVYDIVLMGRIPFMKRVNSLTGLDRKITEDSLKFTDTFYLKDKDINTLSAGEKQRVMIAKALCQTPKILFLDEPTSHLDISHQIEILDLIKRQNKEKGLTVIIVLHDLNLASEYCDRIILLNQGEIFKIGSPQDVLNYQNIEKVYKTVVIVSKNPISNKPHILLVPKK